MTYLAFWQGALVLAAVPILHWLLLGRTFAVSGRITALIDRLRHGAPDDSAANMSEAELLAAIRAETQAMLGPELVQLGEKPPSLRPPSAANVTLPQGPESWPTHVMFFVGAVLGGFVSAISAGTFAITPTLRGPLFTAMLGKTPGAGTVLLFAGGMLVGFGTRMAGGCTSGHGLCGVSQLQKGSLLSTCAFFGMGVVTSFAIGALS